MNKEARYRIQLEGNYASVSSVSRGSQYVILTDGPEGTERLLYHSCFTQDLLQQYIKERDHMHS